MMNGQAMISDQDLHALIDGELDPARAATVAAVVAISPDLAERVDRFRDDEVRIQMAYGPLVAAPLPEALQWPSLRVSLWRRAEKRSAQRRRSITGTVAAAALAASVLLGVRLFAPDRPVEPTERLVAEAISVREGGMKPERTLVAPRSFEEPDRILRSALGMELRTPDLGKAGYELARLDVYLESLDDRFLQITYRNARGELFTVFLHRPSGPDADRFEMREAGRERICIWQNQDLTAVMQGEMTSSEMLRVASLTYAALNF
jgi:anti-sigma factor RsiW